MEHVEELIEVVAALRNTNDALLEATTSGDTTEADAAASKTSPCWNAEETASCTRGNPDVARITFTVRILDSSPGSGDPGPAADGSPVECAPGLRCHQGPVGRASRSRANSPTCAVTKRGAGGSLRGWPAGRRATCTCPGSDLRPIHASPWHGRALDLADRPAVDCATVAAGRHAAQHDRDG